jgi:serine/threonine-protein kinase SRPK3
VIGNKCESPEWLKSLKEYLSEEELKKKNITHNVMLLNSFMHMGPNGKHFIMVFEILGVNLLEIMKRYDYKGIPVPLVRRIAK